MPVSVDKEYVWVELGPIDHINPQHKRYPFPTRKAAERFADTARGLHRTREVRVV